jgi:hypothetical protein
MLSRSNRQRQAIPVANVGSEFARCSPPILGFVSLPTAVSFQGFQRLEALIRRSPEKFLAGTYQMGHPLILSIEWLAENSQSGPEWTASEKPCCTTGLSLQGREFCVHATIAGWSVLYPCPIRKERSEKRYGGVGRHFA